MVEMTLKYIDFDRKTKFRPDTSHKRILEDLDGFVFYDNETDSYGPFILSPQISTDIIRYRSGDYVKISDVIEPTRTRVKGQLDKTRRKTVIHGSHCIPNPAALDTMR